ncbi:nucleotidyltransferase domain-containing protein [Aquisalimonas sp. APHAB1-3]|uniref:nucleotidyltransferase domain-containing protein n=1 Tax=Aquisalimonas sp. APHAB1-3 TaxID=3402080 RepID=UPI003AAC7714
MRLSDQAREIIRRTTQEVFGPDAEVLIFGSRVIDSVRGGDIDLLVRLPRVTEDTRRKSLQLTARLQRRLGDQRIDVLVIDPQTPPTPIYTEALRTGELV